MKRTVIFPLAFLLLAAACGSKNPTVRDTVKKKVADNQSIGVEEFKKGNYSSAKLFLEQALKDASTIDSVEGIVGARQNLAEVFLKLDNIPEASNAIFQARMINEREGVTNDFAVLLTIGKYYDKTGRTDLSLQYYQAALDAAKKDEDKALVYNNIGITKIKQGLLDEALDWVNKSRAINESRQVYNTLADNYFNLGEIYDKKGDMPQALSNYKMALQHDKTAEKSDGIIEDLKRIGQTYQKMGDPDSAVYFYQRALNAADSMGYKADSETIQKLLKDLKK